MPIIDEAVDQCMGNGLQLVIDEILGAAARGKRRLHSHLDAAGLRPFERQHIHAQHVGEERRFGLRREQLWGRDHTHHIFITSEEPHAEVVQPDERLLLLEPAEDRIRIVLEHRQGNFLRVLFSQFIPGHRLARLPNALILCPPLLGRQAGRLY